MNSPIAGLFSQLSRTPTAPVAAAPVQAPPQGIPMVRAPVPAAAPAPAATQPRVAAPIVYDWSNADGTGGGRYPWIVPGFYRHRLVDSRIKETRNGKTLAVIDYEIICTNNPNFAPGSFHSWGIDMQNRDMAPVNLMKLVTAHTGLPASVFKADPAKTQALIETLINDPSVPMRGTVVDATCYNTQTKRGNNFTVIDPRAVPGFTLAEFDELRKAGQDPLVVCANVPVVQGMAPF